MSKKVYLKNFGCQMNEYDSELIRSILAKDGWDFTENESQADLILLNTCAVREHAVRRVRGSIHDIRYRAQGRPLLIGALGCIPTYFKEDLIHDRNLKIDFIAGPDSYRRLPELIRHSGSQIKPCDLVLDKTENYDDILPSRESKVNAWVAIMRGCDNFCTFCVVPSTRGRERSRPPQKILDEIKKAVDDGFPQVTLLGQNVNSYKSGTCDFSGLLDEVSAIAGLKRIRFMSPHPKDFPRQLLKVMQEHDNICRHIHLPLQAGGDRILKMMNRNYTQREYLDLVDNIRATFKQIALTTDIIVGFPTETDEEFEDTVKVMKEVQFDSVFIFKYSQRKGTLAATRYPDDVTGAKKTERIVKLNDLQKEISFKKNRAAIGTIEEILIEEETTTKSIKDFQGRTDGNKLVIVPHGPYRTGQFVKVKITDATPHVLKGKAVPNKT